MSTKIAFKRTAAVIVLISVLIFALILTGCENIKSKGNSEVYTSDSQAEVTESPSLSSPENTVVIDGSSHVGSFYGSFLTMVMNNSDEEYPSAYVMHSYSEIEDYYYDTEYTYSFGQRFTLTCASFDGDFFTENDLLIVVIKEPSTYVSHTADGIELSYDGVCKVSITRHIPSDAPLSDDAVFHLLFTAPKGGFDDIDTSLFEVDITETIDEETSSAYDAERFTYCYPEFFPSTFKATRLNDSMIPVVSTIESFDELIGFYEKYKTEFEFDSLFLKYFGPVFDEQMFDYSVLFATIFPYKKGYTPSIDSLYTYNLQIFITIDGLQFDYDELEKDEIQWYLITIVIDKSGLDGIDTSGLNIAPA